MTDLNNLYNNLTNFYNVNDENFKEFMAEFYKQSLSNHRDIQYVKDHLPDEISKKIDKYLNDGSFNINIEQKVEEFIQNSEKINDILTQLGIIKKKQFLNFSDYGEPNNPNVDNSPHLIKALNELNKTGGTLIIPQGNWYFNTPIIFDKWLFGCKITGVGRGVLNNETTEQLSKGLFGTRLTFQGDGTFVTFNGKMNSDTIENIDIYITSPSSYGFKFNYTFHRGILREVNISGGAGAIELNTGTYVTMENVRYTTSSNVAKFGIRIGLTDTNYTTEFLYFNKCSFDFGKLSNANGIEIYKCSGGVWLSNLDICNTLGSGFLIDNRNEKSINYFNLRDINFSGVSTATEFIPTTGNIGGIFMNGIRHGFNNKSESEKFIYVHRDNTSYTVSLNVKNTYLRLLNFTTLPQYVIYLDGCNANETYIDLTSGDNKTKFTSPIFMSNDCIVNDYRITYAGKLSINFANETPTGSNANYKDYKIKISDLYHAKTRKPIVMFTSNTYQQIGFIKSEVTDNILYAYVRVPIDLTTTTVNLYYNIVKDVLYY